MTVAEIQRALLARGYDLGPSGADGDAGPRTIAAVTAFQRSAGLVADGIAGPKTQAALQKADISERREAPEKPGWLILAAGEVGVREGAGSANNPASCSSSPMRASPASSRTWSRGVRRPSAPC